MIREYRPNDLEDLMSVWTAASAIAHPFLSREFLELERHNIPNVHLPKADTWVFETDGRVVGFIALLGNEVGALFVDPGFHRNGIGRSLLNHARTLRSNLEVEVFRDNAMGTAFYLKNGFHLIEEKMHDDTGLPILRLRLAAGP